MFDWITGFVERGGYFAVALLMFAENAFPPIPSELIMPLAGFTAAAGQLNIFGTILAGSAGSLLGALAWYYIGVQVGPDRLEQLARRHGRWLTMAPEDVDQACTWFNRQGGAAVFFGRLIPAVRTLISIPAGIARMPLGRFLLYSSLGTCIWTGILAGIGYFLEDQYTAVAGWVNPISNGVVALLFVVYLYRVSTFRR